MWEVGKKYISDNNSIRTCLLMYESSVVLSPLENNVIGLPKNEPIVIHKIHYKHWEEYKEPVVLKAWIPVLRHLSKETYISLGLGSVKSKKHVEDYIERNYPNHTILDIIEVTWQEKE
jgi:hypothetical protein